MAKDKKSKIDKIEQDLKDKKNYTVLSDGEIVEASNLPLCNVIPKDIAEYQLPSNKFRLKQHLAIMCTKVADLAFEHYKNGTTVVTKNGNELQVNDPQQGKLTLEAINMTAKLFGAIEKETIDLNVWKKPAVDGMSPEELIAVRKEIAEKLKGTIADE